MQIVRDLAGFTLGRSDLLRRAMSKKKLKVMEEERKNFVYGNEEQGIDGCIRRGIKEQTANKIYDDMIDFAKYAFNKSHAAAYAVVSYQTAYLKYYYPVEFMAALMTSVIDNSSKVSEYILSCKHMGITILPPDINEGQRDFSVSGHSIRYGLSAIKSVGRSVIDEIVKERAERGKFTNIQDFVTRMAGRDVNKRAIENFIKAGAFDSLPGNRKQLMLIYASVLDQANAEKKNNISGQMSLFDLVPEEEKQSYEIALPNVTEYPKDELLGYEKEVLGVYVSGHPLMEYEERIKKNTNHSTSDFEVDEDGYTKVRDKEPVMVGGMITGITVKTTKTNQIMAFLTLEDLVGTVEIIVFPKTYEKYRQLVTPDRKVFIRGRAAIEEDANGKIIAEELRDFGQIPRQLWIRFADKEEFLAKEEALMSELEEFDGTDEVVLYLNKERQRKILPPNQGVKISEDLKAHLERMYGSENVRIVEKKA